MGKKPRNDKADVLPPAPKTDPNVVMRAYHVVRFVPPEVVQDWLSENIKRVVSACRQLEELAPEIRDGSDVEKRQAYDVSTHGRDFLDIAKPALHELTAALDLHPAAATAVALSISTGIRLGMLYERLESLAHGRFKRIWEDEDHAEAMRQAKAAADAEKAATYRREAEEALAWARWNFPHDAQDNPKKIKAEAAKRLGIGVSQLNKRLNPKKK